MAPHAIDIVAGGPPPSGPYEPAAPAWALAEGLGRGHRSVRVLYPATGVAAPPAPPGTVGVPITLRLRHPGSATDPADFAREAGAQVRPDADSVLRDPVGLGPLGGHRRGSAGHLIGFVRSLGITEFERTRGGAPTRGIAQRVDSWREQRIIRRLEKAAVSEPGRLLYDDPEVGAGLAREYGIPAQRMVAAPRAVAPGPPAPERNAARGSFGIPVDVPVVAAVCASESPGPAGVDVVREAFQRIRPFFAGARLIIAGSTAPVTPGIVSVPRRDAESFGRALAAADVAVFAPRAPGFDPGVILALRQGVASVAMPTVRFPIDPARAVRTLSSADPGDFASALAELLADLAQRREVAARGTEYATRFDPDRVIADLERAGVLPAG